MKDQNEEEKEKFNLFQKEIIRENDFLKKIKDIFVLQNSEKFQDILILQKNKYIDLIEKEVLFILQKLYSENIISHRRFNSLFKMAKDEFISKYNSDYEDIYSEWEYFNELKNNNYIEDEDKINSYYLTDFRKHCHNHEGQAIHKCGHAEKGKFIKICGKFNARIRNNKDIKYIICEECKKVYIKDLFNSYCTYCKENYLCSILSPSENKDYFYVTYTSPHCESFINKIIPCKLCKEKLNIFINDKKIKCLKCNYVIDVNNKSDFQWQCTKCNKYFKSNIKIFNPSESYILTKILKKALLLKIKARPQFMNCCNIDINNTPFFHKKECKGILYLCNVENYSLKNKKWVIVCDKCHAINNCKNFIWTCPKCGKRTRESNNDNIELLKSPQRKVSASHYNINKVEDENDINKNDHNANLFKKYLSNYINKKPNVSSSSNDNNKRKKNEYVSRVEIYKNNNENKQIEEIVKKETQVIKVNMKINDNPPNNINTSNSKYIIRSSKRYNNRNNQSISNININNSSCMNSINSINIINNRDKYANNINIHFIDNSQNNEKKKMEKSNQLQRIDLIKKQNSIIYSTLKEEEKNREQKCKRGDSYKSSSVIDEKEEKINEAFNLHYLSQNNFEENKNIINSNQKNLIFNLQNKKNMPVRLRYNNVEKNINNINNYNKNKQNFKKSLVIEEANKINKEYDKNEEEELINKSRRFIFNSIDEKILNGDGRISKDTTTQGSKGSVNSNSKDINNNNNNYNNSIYINNKKLENSNPSTNNSREKDYFSSTSNNFNFKGKRKY